MSCRYCNETGWIDNVFIVGDLKQAEAMIVAHCLRRIGHPKLYDLYQIPGFDVHRWAASPIFNCTEKDVTKYQREVGKLSNHSGNYGAGPRVLVDKALKDGLEGIDYPFAKRILEIRHEQLPGLKAWWKQVEFQLQQKRSLTTCFGRRRLFFGPINESVLRDAISYEPQSTCGDVCNTIFRRLFSIRLEPSRSMQSESDYSCLEEWKDVPKSFLPFPLIQVHDEVVLRCPNIPEIVKLAIEEFKAAAIVPLQICEDIPLIIPIELKIGPNWKNTKEIS